MTAVGSNWTQPTLVTTGKIDETTEIYRKGVSEEHPVEDCFRDTGNAPTPMRRVPTNKGDELRPMFDVV